MTHEGSRGAAAGWWGQDEGRVKQMRTGAEQGRPAWDEPAPPDTAAGAAERRMIDIVLPAVPTSVSAARHAVANLLNGTRRVPVVVVEDVLLLVSELVTNAVLHARTYTRVSASVRAGRVVVAVGDADPHHAPFLAERGTMATNGRGVMLVDALASDWGIDLREHWKVVWFETTYDAAGTVMTQPPVALGPNGQPLTGRGRIRHRAASA